MDDQLAPNSVRTYHLAPKGFIVARNKLWRQKGVVFAGISVFLVALQYKEFGQGLHGGSIASLLPVLFPIPIVLGAIAIGVMKGVKRNHETWTSYELLIGEDFVLRRMKDFPELEIHRDEITAIKESPAGLHVETNLKDRVIGIAPALVDYDDAKERLSRWMPVRQSQRRWMGATRWAGIVPLFTLFLLGALYITNRSWVVVATGVPLLVGLPVCIWFLRTSGQVSSQTKRLSLMAIFPLLAVAVKLVLAIINWR